MLSCYIIDDEPHAIKSLLAYIEKTPWLQVSGYQENPLTALSNFQQTQTYPDITFLDIEMPQISGLELSAILQGKTTIVLTTAYPDFALEAFEYRINDYLLKPFSYERFLKCVHKINDEMQAITKKNNTANEDFFYIQTEGKGKVIKLMYKEILYIESQKNYLSIVTAHKKYLTYLTLTEMEGRLPATFLRTSKSYIINIENISHVEGHEIFLSDIPDGIPISSSYRDAFATHMKKHLIKTKRF